LFPPCCVPPTHSGPRRRAPWTAPPILAISFFASVALSAYGLWDMIFTALAETLSSTRRPTKTRLEAGEVVERYNDHQAVGQGTMAFWHVGGSCNTARWACTSSIEPRHPPPTTSGASEATPAALTSARSLGK
jgi:hypothetical protein